MHLEFLIRDAQGQRTETAIRVPCHYAWQEGPNDLHIQFTRDDDNWFPEMNAAGDYVLPDPVNLKGTVACYHMAWRPETVKPQPVYVERIRQIWSSPNRHPDGLVVKYIGGAETDVLRLSKTTQQRIRKGIKKYGGRSAKRK